MQTQTGKLLSGWRLNFCLGAVWIIGKNQFLLFLHEQVDAKFIDITIIIIISISFTYLNSDLQDFFGGFKSTTIKKQLPDLLSEMLKYCCLVKTLYLV